MSLARKRRLTRFALWFERLWLALWPAVGVLGVYAAAALLGLQELLPPWSRLVLLAAVVAAGVEASHPTRPDGTAPDFEEALRAARTVAEREGVDVIYAIDRTAGPREQEILRHGGDHSVGSAKLDDFDLEDGERGPDMRDRR